STYALTGHPVGGVCPFALAQENISIYLDVSLKRFETVFPACGSANSAIELTIAELVAMAQSKGWVDVCSNWQ
ncbi:MAG: YbaK/EbsC family protein, partial [Sphaerochaetaceae bacterium]|nr:YbaK/EbsC family protein [Sphaerochaetaceae bacterium]